MAEKGWTAHVGYVKINEDNLKVPIFGWTYVVGGLGGGDVHAYPHLGFLNFQTRRKDYSTPGYTGNLSDILNELNTFGWGKLPHGEEVYNDVKEANEVLKNGDLEKFLEHCTTLEKKWKDYISEEPAFVT